MKLLFVGPSRCGKDEAGIWFGKNTNLKFAGTTSLFLAKHVAAHLGLPEHEAYRRRHEPDMQKIWHLVGKQIRNGNPGRLIREALECGDVSGGVRDFEEIVNAHDYVDLVIWVDRPGCQDPTLEFDSTYADIVIQNHWGLNEYHAKLTALASTLGVLKKCCGRKGEPCRTTCIR